MISHLVVIIVLSAASVHTFTIVDYNDYYDYDGTNPKIISESKVFEVNLGDSVTLPCQTEYLAPLLTNDRGWTHNGHSIIFYSSTVTKNQAPAKKNIKLKTMMDLEVKVESKSDSGEYICKIKDQTVIHKIVILHSNRVTTTTVATTLSNFENKNNSVQISKYINPAVIDEAIKTDPEFFGYVFFSTLSDTLGSKSAAVSQSISLWSFFCLVILRLVLNM